jgi:hypothetical protein
VAELAGAAGAGLAGLNSIGTSTDETPLLEWLKYLSSISVETTPSCGTDEVVCGTSAEGTFGNTMNPLVAVPGVGGFGVTTGGRARALVTASVPAFRPWDATFMVLSEASALDELETFDGGSEAGFNKPIKFVEGTTMEKNRNGEDPNSAR